ncbi:hypothetical protein HG263_07985 [Pseudoalteromonas sp. JBTF-M23]|uniref:Fibrinogen C-terminal domain-containing protein n=1 Tax=Pseudoalteromonas caenipelagi TaxID=2726988 RepID=A0A849VA36_9GAMM|nr:fibrinogen-like YCDxxxxGGGW domain-containing protein [Pseudoalteromonas caenipelagi]NOU50479.1 hypothetical protein [Pseudoalteromonas caenipelagi]
MEFNGNRFNLVYLAVMLGMTAMSTQAETTSSWIEQPSSVVTSKDVGIGISSPSEALHVQGNAIADDPLQDNHLVTKRYVDSIAHDLQDSTLQLSQQLATLTSQYNTLNTQYQTLSSNLVSLESRYNSVSNQLLIALDRIQALEDKLTPVGRNCLDIITQTPQATTGFYLVDPDGADVGVQAFKVWCDMDYQGGGWTLFANHKDNIENIQVGELISPNEFSVMKAERWQALRATVTGGMMFKDEHGKISQIYQAKVQNANCRNIYTEDDLAQLSTLGDYGLIWHHEDTNCDVSWDFSGVILGDKDSTRVQTYTYQGASVIQAPHSKTRFDVWPYGNDESSRYHQDQLLYFVK